MRGMMMGVGLQNENGPSNDIMCLNTRTWTWTFIDVLPLYDELC